jgi:diguanylate cyclase (GGDEF)-like protein
MPNIKGDEFLISTHTKLPNAKKIMLTGQASFDGVTNVINYANLYRYISKPWENNDLILSISEAMKSYIQQIELKSYQENLEKLVELRTKELNETIGKLEEEIKAKEEIEKKLYNMALTDPLTSIHNRRYFFQKATSLFEKSKLNQKDLSVLMIDIDFFKNINDKYGHKGGDKTLQIFSKILVKLLNNRYIFARIGGEEFAIIVEHKIEKAVMLAEKIRITVEKVDIPCIYHNKINFTISIGVSSIMNSDNDFDDILMRADKELYNAKMGGRNRVSYSKDNIS